MALIAIMVFSVDRSVAAEVDATLDRLTAAAGSGAILHLKVTGGKADSIRIPEVTGLVVQSRGQSQQWSRTNGRNSHSVTYDYVVGSHQAGEYEIPAIEVTVAGETFKTQPLKLQVTPGATAPADNDEPAKDDSGGNKFGFLTVELAGEGREHAYVGEIAPVIIRAWLPEDSRVQLRSGIQPEGSGFTLHNVSERPQQERQIRDGKRYLVVTWFGGISATKAGKLPASLSVDATVAIRDTTPQKRPRRRMGGAFNDPFFDDIFDDLRVPMIQKEVTLKSEDQTIEVLPLPEEGRPDGFTGAVGNFKFDGVKVPSDWRTGEPNQISARLSGSGNFALLAAPKPTPEDAWKIYPGKDEFKAGDLASFSGSKDFQFSVVPKIGGPQDIALTFSYFDPAVGEYRTLSSPSQNINVAGEDLPTTDLAATPSAAEPEKPAGGLVAQHVRPQPASSLVPLVDRPAFRGLLGASAAMAALGGLLGLMRVRRDDPRRIAGAALDAATREALDRAEKSAITHDAAGYFAAARLALQHQLGARWNQPPEAITLAEISTRLPDDSPVAKFFREADRVAYQPVAASEVPSEWRTLLDEALDSIHPNPSTP